MPLYEYDCRKCGKRSEHLAGGPRERPRCPHCGARRLARLFSVFAATSAKGGDAPPPCGQGACPACAGD
ncbi:MAG: FmdB family zinc ribbon protein [Planctomycetota bacterium]